jgi:protein-disulfide isomerase
VLEKYPKEVKIAFKNFPLSNHKFAKKAAVAALAANRQGKFWQFHNRLFENYKELSDDKIREISQQVGLDRVRFEKDLKDPRIQAKISKDLRDGAKAGVQGTPTIFINGRRLRDRTLEGFQAVIEKELIDARKK